MSEPVDVARISTDLAMALGEVVHTWSDFEARVADLFVSVLKPQNRQTGYVLFYSMGNLQPRLSATSKLIDAEAKSDKRVRRAKSAWSHIRKAATKVIERRNHIVHGMRIFNIDDTFSPLRVVIGPNPIQERLDAEDITFTVDDLKREFFDVAALVVAVSEVCRSLDPRFSDSDQEEALRSVNYQLGTMSRRGEGR